MFNNVLPKKKRAVYKNVERYREAGQARDDTIRLTSFSFATINSIQTCTPDGYLYRVTYTRCRIDTINSPDDGHMADRNM